MANELTVRALERELQLRQQQFVDVLAGRMPVERLLRTVLVCVERTPKLLDCSRQSLMNACMTHAILGLEVDGVTGQGYILPFKGSAQAVIGYKGYNTLGARARLTITGEVVREGDDFDFELGTRAFVRHKPSLRDDGRIFAAWATATASDRPPIVSVLKLSDLEAVKAKAPGAKMSESPWNDPRVGLPAMYGKTAKRRLARSTPLVTLAPEFHIAAAIDEAHEERGKLAYATPDKGVVIEGDASPFPERDNVQPSAADLTQPRQDPDIERLERDGFAAAQQGMKALERWRDELSEADYRKVREIGPMLVAKAKESGR